jgi:hypothetical protein
LSSILGYFRAVLRREVAIIIRTIQGIVNYAAELYKAFPPKYYQ